MDIKLLLMFECECSLRKCVLIRQAKKDCFGTKITEIYKAVFI